MSEFPMLDEVLERMADAMESHIGDHPEPSDFTAAASDILEHLDSLALIRWPFEYSCAQVRRYTNGAAGGLMCMRRRGHDRKHRQGDVEW